MNEKILTDDPTDNLLPINQEIVDANTNKRRGNAVLAEIMEIGLAMGGHHVTGPKSYSTGASSKLPHDPERMKRAEEKRARKALKRNK